MKDADVKTGPPASALVSEKIAELGDWRGDPRQTL